MSDDLRTLIQSRLDKRDQERLEAANRRDDAWARVEEAQRQREAATRKRLREAIRNAQLLDYTFGLSKSDDAVVYVGLRSVPAGKFAVLKTWANQNTFWLAGLLLQARYVGADMRNLTGEMVSREACIDAMLDEYGLEPVDWTVE